MRTRRTTAFRQIEMQGHALFPMLGDPHAAIGHILVHPLGGGDESVLSAINAIDEGQSPENGGDQNDGGENGKGFPLSVDVLCAAGILGIGSWVLEVQMTRLGGRSLLTSGL